MRYLNFTIKNYKGIKETTIPLLRHSSSASKIFTFVGLNESGKTTLLEAMYFFYNYLNGKKTIAENDLIPRHLRLNFNASVEITAQLLFESREIHYIRETFIEREDFDEADRVLSVKIYLDYVDSNFHQAHETIDFLRMTLTTRKNKKPRAFNTLIKYNELIDYIKDHCIPEIVYYEDFIFQFPNAVNLESYPKEAAIQSKCREMLQDILNSLSTDLSLEKHIVRRLKPESFAESAQKAVEEFSSVILHTRKAADDTVANMEGKVNEIVIDSMKKIFGFKEQANKSISLKLEEAQNGNERRLHISFRFKDGQDTFEIRERSLGFRWFFSFLMFSLFRGYRYRGERAIFFLIDEPASNLHQSAQAHILKLLEYLTTANARNSICYTTHSLHLIEPRWLDDSFVVFNSALNYERLNDPFAGHQTEISIKRYREFVNEFPEKTSYFQPVLDHLAYRPTNFEFTQNAVFVEGKYDFYMYGYFLKRLLPKARFSFMPGVGSKDLGAMINLYLGWGKKFLILLDGDRGGRDAKTKYRKEFGTAVEDRVYTLEEVGQGGFKNYKLEKLIAKADRDALGKTKKNLNLRIQEINLTGEAYTFAAETLRNFQKVFVFIEDKLSN